MEDPGPNLSIRPYLQHFPVVFSRMTTKTFFQFLKYTSVLSDSESLLNLFLFPWKSLAPGPASTFLLYSFFKIYYKCHFLMENFTPGYNPVNSSNNGASDFIIVEQVIGYMNLEFWKEVHVGNINLGVICI